ncbi:enoyl-CoA hydratase/isomerase family protein [Sediminicoccus rosea]|uniref:Enoyl-CoA hydratase-related protein n=1 Tax=Sediminicoccus rosea TaxID=1225128 RepID=A0ABZ0PBC7_9PROT|nr:enoyl-CoA hydratase-related protein [Sediminicoccus rosea]WPB82993.1 enoyl-CoA hydratase-related protein [Sediminicoccus rosea]
MQFETLALEFQAPHLLIVRLNRPEVANALNTQMGRDLLALWTSLTEDSRGIRCVVFTGAGGRAFCAGGDLKERLGMTDAQWQAQHEIFERAYWALMDCPIPVIAAVNGHAYAGGLEMVLASDFAYGAENARFALTEVTIGIMPGAGGTQNLPRAVGERRAKEIILTGRPFTAQQALDWGILNAVYPMDDLLPAALETATRIAENAPLSVRQAKKSIHYGLQMDVRTAFRFEIEAYNRLVGTEDRHEGIASFNEKRKPVFKGR